MTLLVFILGSIILSAGMLAKDGEMRAEPQLLHLIYVPCVSMAIGFIFDIKPILGFIAAGVIFVMTLYLWVATGNRKSWILRFFGVLIGEVAVVCLLMYWVLFNLSFIADRTYTDFEPSVGAAIAQDFHIKDNGTFSVDQITDSRDWYSFSVTANTTPEVFINELMDKEVYDTEQLYWDVQRDFDRCRGMIGTVRNSDGTPYEAVCSSISLSDYLKDPDNDAYNNVKYGSAEVLFDQKNRKCTISSSSQFLGRASAAAAAAVHNKTDTFEKKLNIILNES